ncbi:MAG: ABC transporter permease [Chloroflexi bacterium]|nr:ABC transporter permease [Chloroflexota bacterium]
MSKYIIKRLLLFIPSALGILLVVFVLVRLVPGDVVAAMAGDASVSEADRQIIQRQLGLDRPLVVQFVVWFGNVLQGDFGQSIWEKRPVVDMLKERIPRSLELTAIAVTLGVVWGITLGVISAIRRRTLVDYVVRVISIAGISLPSFVTGILLLYLMLKLFHWSPPVFYETIWANPGSNLVHQMLPAMVLGFAAAAPIARLTRSSLLEVIGEDYMRTARAKGLSERVVIMRHALKNALLPVITLSGGLVAGLLGGVVIVEAIFVIPGMGTGLIDAVTQRDYPALQAYVIVMSLIYLTVNLLVDLSYGLIDPRIRYG